MTEYCVPFGDLHEITKSTLRLIVEREPSVTLEEALFSVGSAIGIAMAARAGLGLPDLGAFEKSVNAGIARGAEVAVKAITEEMISHHGGRQ